MTQCTSVFDETAADFASKVDRQIDSGRYRRGDLFLAGIESSVPSNGYILDYGCGPGRIAAHIARRGFGVLGLDPSPGMIELAKRQNLDGLRVEFRNSKTFPVDMQQGTFDAIVCSSVIEYEAEPEQLLGRFSSALHSSGKLIISFANSRSLSRMFFHYRNLHLTAQRQLWTWSQFRLLLERTGFSPIQGATYFDSFFDRFPPLSFLSKSSFVGGLGLVIAVKSRSTPRLV